MVDEVAGAEQQRDKDRRSRGTGARDRLLDAAMRLFAEQGYRATTVGEIEASAGLAPRSGALYQYFSGKDDLLRAGIEKHMNQLQSMTSAVDMLPLADLRSEIILLGRWNLQDLTRRESLYRLLRREGEVIPGLLGEVRQAIHDVPHQQIADWIRRRAQESGVPEPDCEALAVILAGAMGHFRELESMYGEKPLGIDDERFLRTWVEVCLAVSEHFGLTQDDRPADGPHREAVTTEASTGKGSTDT